MSSESRRRFIMSAALAAALPAVAGAAGVEQEAEDDAEGDTDASAITAATIAEAERLAGITFTDEEREVIATSVRENIARFGRRVDLGEFENGLAPATTFDPRLPGEPNRIVTDTGNPSLVPDDGAPMPSDARDIAFAPVTRLSRWIADGQITSRKLTELYLERLNRFDSTLRCVITPTPELALAQADRADQEMAEGKRRGPLHGIPWGAKDILDTAGIKTTYGAMPYKDRVPDGDAVVVERLRDAGAVLLAKLSVGALAYGDIWFDARTRNPWNPQRGSSGSSAGPGSATAAGLCAFAIGTETYGSIISPCMVNGTTGLRPTFGRVARSGCMALCWSLDKIGPMCRTVADTALVLDAINGADAGDPTSIDMPLHADLAADAKGLRVGYVPEWFEGRRAAEADRAALEAARRSGCELVEMSFPEWPYDILLTSLHAEAAAAFETLTRTDRDDELVWQTPNAWPNSFRTTWFTPAIELVQAERFRRRVMTMMHEKMGEVDAILTPSFAGSLLLITNNTGHPALILRAGFRTAEQPHGVTLIGRLFDEGTLIRIGMALERELDVWDRRPKTS